MKKLLTVLGFILIVNTLYGQDTTYSNRYWVSMGGGNYSSAVQNKGVVYLSLNANIDKAIFKLRLITHEEIDFVIFSPPPEEVFNSVGLMLGKIHKMKNFQVQFTGGIGVIEVRRKGSATGYDTWIGPTSYQIIETTVPSLLFEIEFTAILTKRFGAGITLFTDINREIPMTGIAFNFSIGNLK